MQLCKEETTISKTITKPLNTSYSLQYSFYENFDQIRSVWQSLAQNDVLASPDYLQFITEDITEDIKPYFVVVSQENIPLYGLIFQLKKIKLSDSIRTDGGNDFMNLLKKPAKILVEKFFNVYTLVSGNLFVTGEYSLISRSKIPTEKVLSITKEASVKLADYVKRKENKTIGIFLFKDFYSTNDEAKIVNLFPDLTQFHVQPNMVFCVDEKWNTFDDYIDSFKSKYRVRYRRAQKKNAEITKRELSLAELESFNDKIHELYLNVSQNAGYNLFVLAPDYFVRLKKAMREYCKVIGYFKNDELVSFSSVILNHSEVEAHFLGYNPDYNKEYQLYLNMLFDIVDIAITTKKETINFSRTALEIKCSVGAKPKQMTLYLKYKNPIVNKFVPYFLKFFTPKYDLIERSPF